MITSSTSSLSAGSTVSNESITAEAGTGALTGLLTAEQRTSFGRFCADLDRLGRTAEVHGDQPLINRTALGRLIGDPAGKPVAEHLIGELDRLPDSRLTDSVGYALPWTAVADRVVVYDGAPVPLTRRLDAMTNMGQLMAAVRQAYPSLELELIDPQGLPHQLSELTGDRSTAVVHLVHRSLGWWGVLGYALMTAAAAGCRAPGWAAWPLYVSVLAGSIGGWTLTVVGGCALSR